MNRTVLIVDDSPVQCRLVEAAVARAGWSARICTNAEAAFGVLTRTGGSAVDVVLLDLVMDGSGGLDLLRRLRACGIDVPVVVQTSRSEIAVVVECMREGARDFLVKPASAERVLSAIEEAARRPGPAEPAAGDIVPAEPAPISVRRSPPRTEIAADPAPAPPHSGSVGIFDASGEIRSMEDIEAEIIAMAMAHYGGRRATVARRMGLGRSTLYRKLRSMPQWDAER